MNDEMQDRQDAIVLPIGQYLGAMYDESPVGPRAHLIRMGWQEGEIVDPHDIDLWFLAHGAWSGLRGRWSLGDLRRAADDTGIADIDTRVVALCRAGLVAVLADEGEMTEFAKSHRLHALMAGLGASDAADESRSLGIVGQTPFAVIDAPSYDLWQWGPQAADIWAAATMMFHRPVDTARPHLSRESHLHDVLGSIQMLVSRGAVYVDRVATSLPPRRFPPVARRSPPDDAGSTVDDHGGPQ